MKRSLVVLVALALTAGALAAPAEAGKKKKKKPAPAPVATTFFFHGSVPVGEVEAADHVANGTYMTMSAEEPSGQKTMGLTNYLGGPNTNCAGNALFPTWRGDLTGTVSGDLKVTFSAMATPGGKVAVRAWPDINALTCNESYPTPAAEAIVDLPAGSGNVEATLKNAAGSFPVQGSLMIQISPVLALEGGTPFQGRVQYDDPGAAVTFGLLP